MSLRNATKTKKSAQNAERDPRSETPALRGTGSRVTRSATHEANNKEEHQKKYDEARKHLVTIGILGSTQPCSPQTISNALQALTDASTKIPPDIVKTIQSLSVVTKDMEHHCAGCNRAERLPETLKELRTEILLTIEAGIDDLGNAIRNRMSDPEGTSGIAERMEEAANNLSKVAQEVETRITKAAETSDQIANNAQTYRDALLRDPRPGTTRQVETEEHRAIEEARERKERQVLVEFLDAQSLSISLEAIQEKAEEAIKQVKSPDSPQDTSIVSVSKTRKNAVVINFNTKEAAQWLRTSTVSLEFEAYFITGADVKPRQYSIVVPRIPLTFDPEDDSHLREVEEANGLEEYCIAKARWIKPAHRRKPGQKSAYATFLINDVNIANKCIKDGLLVCRMKTYPSKLKLEPTQCMKCRGWGHFANACSQVNDTCGTCGGGHRTSNCTEEDKKYCASCKDNSHASWDRNCPEFVKRCSWFDNKHPDNMLKYFPTDAAWTQQVRPARLPFHDRFPARFAVGSLPPPNRNGRELPTRPIEKPTKRSKNKDKRATEQMTLENYYVSRSQSQNQNLSGAENISREEGEVESDLFFSSRQSDNAETESIETSGW